jgi:hypothetical protein
MRLNYGSNAGSALNPIRRVSLLSAVIILAVAPLAMAESPPIRGIRVAEKPAKINGSDIRINPENLPALIDKYTPLSGGARVVDPAITFDRIDIVMSHFRPAAQSPYLVIARDGSYLYLVDKLDFPDGHSWPPANLGGRLPASRMTELQRILEETEWLNSDGGEGPARQLHPGKMTIALTRDGTARTVQLEGDRPAPYQALQKFFEDLEWQEQLFYRLTRVPEEWPSATRELHDAIQSQLGRAGKGRLPRDVTFERYFDLFAGKLHQWYVAHTDELRTAVELMVLLERSDQFFPVARLRFDRDLNLRTTVAQAMPVLGGQKAIRYLVEMIESTAEARISLIQMGEPAVPHISSIIESDEAIENSRSVALIRAYIDNWDQITKPIDARIVKAVVDNLQVESVRDRAKYHREFLKLVGEAEPQPATAVETLNRFLKYLKAGDNDELQKLKDHIGKLDKWLVLGKSFEPAAELELDRYFTDKTTVFAVTKPFRTIGSDEIHLVIFMNLVRGTDWRVSAVLEEPAGQTRYLDRFLQSNPDAQEVRP